MRPLTEETCAGIEPACLHELGVTATMSLRLTYLAPMHGEEGLEPSIVSVCKPVSLTYPAPSALVNRGLTVLRYDNLGGSVLSVLLGLARTSASFLGRKKA